MDTKEPIEQNEEEKVSSSESSENHKKIAIDFISANIKTITIIVLAIIVLSRLFTSAPQHASIQGNEAKPEELIQKSEEMEKSGKLSALPSVQKDFNMAKDFMKNLFAKHDLETSAFRLTDVYNYYITPAQEANGLQDAKRLAIRFAIKRQKDAQWYDLKLLRNLDRNVSEELVLVAALAGRSDSLPSAKLTATQKNVPSSNENDLFLDLTVWNGKMQVDFTTSSFEEKLNRSLEYHKENGFN